MTLDLTAVTFDAADPSGLAAFWGGLLGRPSRPDRAGTLLPADGTQVGLGFRAATSEKTGLNRLHLHLTSQTLAHQQATVDRVLELGGRHIDVGQLPDEEHVVLADPEGNEFCVIEPGNNFLAGCGYLAEVACDGTREVGLFWHRALGWPLVWDRGEETAIQSPAGGTKVSWGGSPVPPKTGRSRQRFQLSSDDPVTESRRLCAIGATLLGEREDCLELADPDGNEFAIRPR
jgi:predicted enzyme related to lactoylglutathione lyase